MEKRNKIIYWIITIWLSLGMVSGGIFQLMRMEEALKNFAHLGYPIYLLSILGIWKLLAVIAILIPKYPIVKEWAYAGMFFTMTGAIVSHIAVKDPFGEIFPSILTLLLVIASWYFRPADRKIAAL